MTSSQKDLFFWCNYLVLFTPVITFYFCNMMTFKQGCICNKAWKLGSTFALLSILMFSFRFNPFLHMIMTNSAIILLVLYAFADPLKYKLLYIAIFYLSSVIAEIMTWSLLILLFRVPSGIVFSESWAAENHIYSTVGSGFINILLLVFYSIIIALKQVLSHQLKSRQLWIYALLPVYQLVLFSFYIYTYQEPDITMVSMGILILFLDMLIDFIMISSIKNLLGKLAVKEDLSILYTQRQMELEYYQAVQKQTEEMRAFRHDFSNHLHTFHSMLEHGVDRQELNQFLLESEEAFKNF